MTVMWLVVCLPLVCRLPSVLHVFPPQRGPSDGLSKRFQQVIKNVSSLDDIGPHSGRMVYKK